MLYKRTMNYHVMIAQAIFLLMVAFVSTLAAIKAYRDGRGGTRSRENRFAITLWTVAAVITLAGGISIAWATDQFFSAPATSW